MSYTRLFETYFRYLHYTEEQRKRLVHILKWLFKMYMLIMETSVSANKWCWPLAIQVTHCNIHDRSYYMKLIVKWCLFVYQLWFLQTFLFVFQTLDGVDTEHKKIVTCVYYFIMEFCIDCIYLNTERGGKWDTKYWWVDWVELRWTEDVSFFLMFHRNHLLIGSQ